MGNTQRFHWIKNLKEDLLTSVISIKQPISDWVSPCRLLINRTRMQIKQGSIEARMQSKLSCPCHCMNRHRGFFGDTKQWPYWLRTQQWCFYLSFYLIWQIGGSCRMVLKIILYQHSGDATEISPKADVTWEQGSLGYHMNNSEENKTCFQQC